MKTLSIVIPAYNESDRLEKTFEALERGFSFRGIKLAEIIFVNDGSTDTTAALIKQWIAGHSLPARLISYTENRGKGYAVRTGVTASKADYTLFFDADMSTPLTELKKFVPVMESGVDVIVGTRKNGHSTVIKHQPLYRELLGRGFTLLSQTILNTWVTDFTCGFKAFSKAAKSDIFSKAAINRWGYDAEILFLANKYGYNMQEVPVVWSNDDRSKVNIFKALPQTLAELFKIRNNELTGVYNLDGAPTLTLKPAIRWITTNLL